MKEAFKKFIVHLLWLQVGRLRQKYNPAVIAVAGSIGKTSTKSAIAKVLSKHLKVQWQDGNYNDIVSVPLIFFGQKMPSLLNPFGWLKVFLICEYQIQTSYPFEVVVVELGTDYRGNMALFQERLHADYGVLTGIAAEHMERFESIDDVADEELVIAEIADTLLVNVDTVEKKYQSRLVKPLEYGEQAADCNITAQVLTEKFRRPVTFTLKNKKSYQLETSLVGKQNLPAMAAAVLLADAFELTKDETTAGLESITPLPGRMQLLKGQKGSLLIDDTYNASPEAVTAALHTIYEAPAKQKIAILGQMNELGDFSPELHTLVGEHCDPQQLKVVITIGEDANSYLADAAEKRGCKVMRCPSPYHAADVAKQFIKPGTLILAKGSQNHVFAEEAVKELLNDPKDSERLVRQSSHWTKIKRSQFTTGS